MPGGGARRQTDEPAAEEVTQKPRELKSSSRVPVFKRQMFPNGALRGSWAASKEGNQADVRPGLIEASEGATEAHGHTPACDISSGLLSPGFVGS